MRARNQSRGILKAPDRSFTPVDTQTCYPRYHGVVGRLFGIDRLSCCPPQAVLVSTLVRYEVVADRNLDQNCFRQCLAVPPQVSLGLTSRQSSDLLKLGHGLQKDGRRLVPSGCNAG